MAEEKIEKKETPKQDIVIKEKKEIPIKLKKEILEDFGMSE